MDNIARITMIFAFFMVLTIELGGAFSCHQCNSGKDYEGNACDDPIRTDDYLLPCPASANYTKCRKIKQDVFGEVRIVRTCALTGQTRCIDRTGSKGVKVTYCQCEGESCNTASATYQSTVVLFVLSVFAIAVTRRVIL